MAENRSEMDEPSEELKLVRKLSFGSLQQEKEISKLR